MSQSTPEDPVDVQSKLQMMKAALSMRKKDLMFGYREVMVGEKLNPFGDPNEIQKTLEDQQ